MEARTGIEPVYEVLQTSYEHNDSRLIKYLLLIRC